MPNLVGHDCQDSPSLSEDGLCDATRSNRIVFLPQRDNSCLWFPLSLALAAVVALAGTYLARVRRPDRGDYAARPTSDRQCVTCGGNVAARIDRRFIGGATGDARSRGWRSAWQQFNESVDSGRPGLGTPFRWKDALARGRRARTLGHIEHRPHRSRRHGNFHGTSPAGVLLSWDRNLVLGNTRGVLAWRPNDLPRPTGFRCALRPTPRKRRSRTKVARQPVQPPLWKPVVVFLVAALVLFLAGPRLAHVPDNWQISLGWAKPLSARRSLRSAPPCLNWWHPSPR